MTELAARAGSIQIVLTGALPAAYFASVLGAGP
jgi:hypothetical protein